jgi:hypothetical protein
MKSYSLLLILFIFTACDGKKTPQKELVIDSAKINAAMKKLALPEKVKDPYLEGISINDFDNINLCGTNFQFSKIDSVFIPDYNEQSVLFDKMIDSIGNVHDGAMILEKQLQSSMKAYFSRKGKVLTLFLSNGKTVKLKDFEKEGELTEYSFEGYLENFEYYLVRIQFYEGGGYLLINRKNGFQKYISGKPYLSPDKTKLMTINVDIEAGYDFNGIELLSFSGDSLKTDCVININNWGPDKMKWNSNKEVIIKAFYMDKKENADEAEYKKKYFKLILK